MEKTSLEYIKATADIFFERGHVACAYCPMLETYARNQCRITGEYILDTKFTVGHWCPLGFEINTTIRKEIEQ